MEGKSLGVGLMGHDAFEFTVNFLKLAIVFLMMIQMVPLLVWLERRGSAFIQNRLGPNRVGPLGLLQLVADAIKFITKEQFIPARATKALFLSAPVIALIPAALAFAAIPLSTDVHVDAFDWLGKTWGPYTFAAQTVYIRAGVIYVLGVSSLGAYGLLAAGWGSGSKYSLMGALRASAQMISYELAMGLSIVGILMIYGSFDFKEMIHAQAGPLHYSWLKEPISFLPNWGIFYQPFGALLFLVSAFAESNRLPFDLAEAEGELVAGFHTEYGGFKMLLFFMGEYGHMMVGGGLLAVFFLGGYAIPGVSEEGLYHYFLNGHSATIASLLTSLVFLLSFCIKVAAFLWLFIWVRWTLPRFRYDHLMDLGWKTMLPWALVNTIVTAVVIYLGRNA
jgi:NADH-quinone oxidoreductase subunit H